MGHDEDTGLYRPSRCHRCHHPGRPLWCDSELELVSEYTWRCTWDYCFVRYFWTSCNSDFSAYVNVQLRIWWVRLRLGCLIGELLAGHTRSYKSSLHAYIQAWWQIYGNRKWRWMVVRLQCRGTSIFPRKEYFLSYNFPTRLVSASGHGSQEKKSPGYMRPSGSKQASWAD